jgi:hypothetical protein
MTVDDDIGMVPKVKLIAPNGNYVVVVDMKQHEIASPTLIENWDRRLGVLSPFRHRLEH